MYLYVRDKRKTHPVNMDSLDEWLFVTINTMKAIIDNSRKEDVPVVLDTLNARDTAQIQQMYDVIQGRYVREGFLLRNASGYYYLTSLVARFPNTVINDEDKDKIRVYL